MKNILLAVMIVATSAKADGFRTFVFDGNVAVDIPSNLVVHFNRPDWFWARSKSETNSRSTGMNETGMSVGVGRRNPTYSVEEYRDATEQFLWQHDLKLEQTARQGYQRTKTDKIVTVPFVGVPFSSKINCNGTPAIFTKGVMKFPDWQSGLYVEKVEFTSRTGIGYIINLECDEHQMMTWQRVFRRIIESVCERIIRDT